MKQWLYLAALAASALALPLRAQETAPVNQAGWVQAKAFVQISADITMAYVEWGDPNGDPVILIHGYSDTSRAYSTIAPFLNQHGKRYLAIDLRGHGDSSEPECCYYVSDLAEDVEDFIVAMGIERADVVGHSLGSMTAGVLAGIHPDRVNRLVLISSTLQAGPGTEFLYDTLHSQQFPLDVNGQFINEIWAPESSATDQEMLIYLRAEEAAMPQRAWLGIVKGLETLNWTRAARRITAPTLIIWGDQDQMMIESDQVSLRAALPEAQFIRYEGLGHSPYWENPERVAADINAFLR